jgi:CBS domain-containing protein/mannose-6-phosphate isomerase-like protein (cupin superfamily)
MLLARVVQRLPEGGASMSDTTVSKIDSRHSPYGDMGQRYLASGVKVALRLWSDEPPSAGSSTRQAFTTRDYEVVGYVLSGRASLDVEGQTVDLGPGDSWVVPRGATHRYRIRERFSAIEATAPPAHAHARDERNESDAARPREPQAATFAKENGSSLKNVLRPVQTLGPDDSCLDAAQLMRSENIGSVVIARDGEPLGLVTDRDLAMRVLADAQDPVVVRLSEIMSPHPVFISVKRSLDEAIITMRELGVRRLPVVDERGHLAGIVSLDDMLMRIGRQVGQLSECVQRELELGRF